MKNVTGFEKFLIAEGLDKVQADMIAEIEAAEKVGKTPIMTTGFVELIISDLKLKLKLDK